jgi:hypothetical protein
MKSVSLADVVKVTMLKLLLRRLWLHHFWVVSGEKSCPQLQNEKCLLGGCGKNNLYNKNNCMLMLKPLLRRFWLHHFWVVSGEKSYPAAAKEKVSPWRMW